MFWSSVAGKMHTPRTPPSSTRCAPPSSIHLDLLGFLKSFTSYFGIQVSLGRNYLFVPTDLDLCPCRALMVVMILVRFVVMMIIWRLGLPDRRGHGRVESKSHNWVSTFISSFFLYPPPPHHHRRRCCRHHHHHHYHHHHHCHQISNSHLRFTIINEFQLIIHGAIPFAVLAVANFRWLQNQLMMIMIVMINIGMVIQSSHDTWMPHPNDCQEILS